MDWETINSSSHKIFSRNTTFSPDQFGTEPEENPPNLCLMPSYKLLHTRKKHSKRQSKFIKLILNHSLNIVLEPSWRELKLNFIWKTFKSIISIFLNLDSTRITLSSFLTEHTMLQKLRNFTKVHCLKNELNVHISFVFVFFKKGKDLSFKKISMFKSH